MKNKIWAFLITILLAGILAAGASLSQAEVTYGSSAELAGVQKLRYDFIQNYCSAYWWNSKAKPLACPGKQGSTAGFAILERNPKLENGRSEYTIIWVHPDYRENGQISGKYPAVRIRPGDHFRAKVGCKGGYQKCRMLFSLYYQVGQKPVRYLGSWKEVYGGGTTKIDYDLSHLAGKKARFILRAESINNPKAAHGFWLAPRIVNIK